MRRETRDERSEPDKVAGLSESSEPARPAEANSQETRVVFPKVLRNSRKGSEVEIVPLDSESPATLSTPTLRPVVIRQRAERVNALTLTPLVFPPCLRASVVNSLISEAKV